MAVVRLESQGTLGHIVLDRPPANSYDGAFVDELLTPRSTNRGTTMAARAIVVRSASEKFFSAGADIRCSPR